MTKSVTLIELLIAITLLSVVVLGFISIDVFSRYHIFTSERRTKLQNEVSFILEHMNKNIGRAIGNERINGANTVVEIVNITPSLSIRAYVEGSNPDGQRQAPVSSPASSADHFIAYQFDSSGPNANSVRYCGRCQNSNCNLNQCMDSVEVLGTQITAFTPSPLTDNYVEINIVACWDPAEAADLCGSPDNPDVNMRARIKMPSVSTN